MPQNYQEEKRIIRQARLNKKLVVFVGAGISQNSGLPTWKTAVKTIAHHLGLSEPTSDLYLKIPQYYFNARGKKEYVELMRNVFKADEELLPNECHRKITALGTHTIITTNYDRLLEKAARERQEMIQVISQNKDLAYKSAEREILKIHGDFEHDNFVLKEDDYLHYGKNFAMIEAYVKSLFATNVVLFLGYSFSDPDVKQVFSWVRDVLKDDFQRAYLLEVEKEYNKLEFEYYRNLGINVLYAKEIDAFNNLSPSERLCGFLDELTNYNKVENLLEKLELNCLAYKDLNYIKGTHIQTVFNGFLSYPQGDAFVLYTEIPSEEIKDCIYEKESGKPTMVGECLRKSTAKSLVIRSEKNLKSDRITIEEYVPEQTEVFHAIATFDYMKLLVIRDRNECVLSENTPDLYLQQAYISFFLRDNLKSYSYLKICSQLFYKNRQYTWYFLSEFNRHIVGNMIEHDIDLDEEIRKKIGEETHSINLDIIFDKIPESPAVSKALLKDIYSEKSHYSSLKELYYKSLEVEEEAKTTYLVKSNQSYAEMRADVKESYDFEVYNYIIGGQNTEIYRMFAKSILSSCLSSDKKSYNPIYKEMSASNVHSPCLEAFDIQMILLYFPLKELSDVINENKRDMVVSDNAKEYVLDICNNMVRYGRMDEQYVWKLLRLAGSLKINERMALALLKLFSLTFENTTPVFEHIGITNRLIYSFGEQGVFKYETCRKALSDIVDRALELKSRNNRSVFQRFNIVIRNMLFQLEKAGEPCNTEKLSNHVDEKDFLFLAEIYPIVDRRIKGRITRTLKRWQWEKSLENVHIYSALVVNGITKEDSNIELDILSMINSQTNLKNIGIPDTNLALLNDLLTLYLNDKLINKKKVVKALSSAKNEFFVWLTHLETYDYSKFDINWLLECSNGLLFSIAQNTTAKRAIVEKIKQAYLSDLTIEYKIIEIYFRYFI